MTDIRATTHTDSMEREVIVFFEAGRREFPVLMMSFGELKSMMSDAGYTLQKAKQ